jgi:hypothetical protein
MKYIYSHIGIGILILGCLFIGLFMGIPIGKDLGKAELVEKMSAPINRDSTNESLIPKRNIYAKVDSISRKIAAKGIQVIDSIKNKQEISTELMQTQIIRKTDTIQILVQKNDSLKKVAKQYQREGLRVAYNSKTNTEADSELNLDTVYIFVYDSSYTKKQHSVLGLNLNTTYTNFRALNHIVRFQSNNPSQHLFNNQDSVYTSVRIDDPYGFTAQVQLNKNWSTGRITPGAGMRLDIGKYSLNTILYLSNFSLKNFNANKPIFVSSFKVDLLSKRFSLNHHKK